ncbi:glycoside hydrolase family 43 protein [Treponema sp. J25]|uniref:glycoside hydrolase family 43 protein n=1 Tax=Treponema sp. J25 TaxID=2094121 RepID=UPI001048BF9E|nr:glycoside hydrolase family 43 protein [Treponema sp. J25]TCW61839.1 arabinoxylan arabinofuranohydrolase [Treponema sp. J25]
MKLLKNWGFLGIVGCLAISCVTDYREGMRATEPQIPTEGVAKVPGNGNPLISHKFGADPWALVYHNRVYIYLTSDVLEYANDGSVKENSYSKITTITCISSEDLLNWTDHGEIPVAGREGIATWARNSWAPSVVYKKIDGLDRFFLYFADSANGIGVLVGESPLGPWKDPLGRPLVSKSTPGFADVLWLFDPAVLVDDDGKAYLYCGGGVPPGKEIDPGTARVVKLGDDMISLDLDATGGKGLPLNPPYLFEDSGIHKYKGKYYYSYCTNFSGVHPKTIPTGAIAYMIGDTPLGPFSFVKTVFANPYQFFGVGGNNHHAFFEFRGEWYIVYHAQTLGKALGITKGYRSPHLNKMYFDENALIQDIVGDYKGVPQIAFLNPYQKVEAETMAWSAGIGTEPLEQKKPLTSPGNMVVCDIDTGDWIGLSKVDFGEEGAQSITCNVSSTSEGGYIDMYLDSLNGPRVGTVTVKNTGGNWVERSTPISRVTGIRDVYFLFRGGKEQKNLFKLDWWSFSRKK